MEMSAVYDDGTTAAITNASFANGSRVSPLRAHDATLHAGEILVLIVFVCIFVIGVIGNILVCSILGCRRHRRQPDPKKIIDGFIVLLAVVDFIISLTSPPQFIYLIITKHAQWQLGISACVGVTTLHFVCTNFSIGIILIMTLDRYRVIVTPFKGHFTGRRLRYAVIVAFLMSIVFCLHRIFSLSTRSGTCMIAKGNIGTFSVLEASITISRDVFFLLFFGFTYVKTYDALRSSQRRIPPCCIGDKSEREVVAVMRFIFLIDACFLVAFIPKDVAGVIFAVSAPRQISHFDTQLMSWLTALKLCNSCVNVFIYARLHRRFRKSLRRILALPSTLLRRVSRRRHDSTLKRQGAFRKDYSARRPTLAVVTSPSVSCCTPQCDSQLDTPPACNGTATATSTICGE